MKKDYFTTGEFASICGVSKQTLFYYDRQGIFCPDRVGENGYRYYSYTQIETFTVISMLRDLGVHIKEIRRHMENRSPQSLISLMESKKAEIDKKIQFLQWSAKYIEKRIQTTREGIAASPGVISVQDFSARYMIVSEYHGPDDTAAVTEAIGTHLDHCSMLDIYSACPIGSMIPVSTVTESSHRYSKFYTIVEKAAAPDEAILEPSGSYLVIYDDHGYENIGANCLKLLNYAAGKGYVLGDHFFEDVILDDLSTEGYYNYLVRLSIRIEHAIT